MSPAAETPSLRRRLGCLVYEAVVLSAVVLSAGWLYSILTQQRHALQGQRGLQAFLFAVLGLYFVWFWTHGGQTLAMKTWRIRIVDARGGPLRAGRAALRYVLAYVWVVPALLSLEVSGLTAPGAVAGVLLAGVGAYAVTSHLQSERQFWHDVLAGSRLVLVHPASG